MSILRDYTNAKHREAEAKPFVQYLLHGNITKEHYALYLKQMSVIYGAIEYFAEMSFLLQDLKDIKRKEYIYEDLYELGHTTFEPILPATEKYRQRIVDLYYSDKKKDIFAHVYVRHMGDLYGGKAIAKRVPGSGKAYQFEDRPGLIKAIDSKLSLDLVNEALVGFDLSMGVFDELQEKINE
jgi:heme oxygenase